MFREEYPENLKCPFCHDQHKVSSYEIYDDFHIWKCYLSCDIYGVEIVASDDKEHIAMSNLVTALEV